LAFVGEIEILKLITKDQFINKVDGLIYRWTALRQAGTNAEMSAEVQNTCVKPQ